jgi:putative endonuclease
VRIVGYVYMVRCADGSYYVGSHRGDDPDARVWEHNEGVDRRAYTFTRRPVELVWSDYCYRYDEMVACERQIKGWSRAKKEALIRGDSTALKALSARGVRPSLVIDPSRRRSKNGVAKDR